MAKTKQQKRDEALRRQRQKLITRDIPQYTEWFKTNGPWRDEESDAMYNEAVIKSAHTAHCDRHGNYLDHRFYKHLPIYTCWPDPFDCAMVGTLYSLEEMKTIVNRTADHKGETLYNIAYRA